MSQGKFAILEAFNCLESLPAIDDFKIRSVAEKYQRRNLGSEENAFNKIGRFVIIPHVISLIIRLIVNPTEESGTKKTSN
jgi:hypothetical protein